ncbi:MAG: hypothetical protein HY508_09580 [Acidobacteria bacterium]|nr:hypothetical protein [Acidobacteriota bacterium]
MRSAAEKTMWTVWLVLAVAPPAYANNPPAPDGMLSIILLFPVAIFGFRLAGANLNDKEKKWKTVRGIVLGMSAFLTAAGTGIAIIPLLILLCYGLLRGGQAMARGQGGKRFAIGSGMILFTLFAVANYTTSLSYTPGPTRSASSAVGAIRTIVTAEITYATDKKLDVNHNGIPEYGTLEQLRQAGLIPDSYLTPRSPGNYQLVVVLSGDPARNEKEFFVYATPRQYREPASLVITLSLIEAIRPRGQYGIRSFAADESGIIRFADLRGARAVTREEARKWEPLP